jgi:hypothetical protein
LVVAIEAAAVVISLRAQSVEGTADLLRAIAASGQVDREQSFLDVGVTVAIGPIPEVAIAQFIKE